MIDNNSAIVSMMEEKNISNLDKPLLRGHFHQAALFIFLGASFVFILQLKDHRTVFPFIIYLVSLNLLFLVSTLYHRPNWSNFWRMWMRRFDHAAIYLLIAGTGTPIFLILMDREIGKKLMYTSWATAFAGIIFSLIWVKAPKWLNSLVYFIAGLSILPYIDSFVGALSEYQLYLFFSGAVIYLVGGIFYAIKGPNLFKNVFGYHELFHVLVVIGAFLHFLMIYDFVSLA